MIAHTVRRRVTDTGAVLVGLGAVVCLWIVGGRAGWANGMVVTPAEAVRPLTGDSTDVYVRATAATVSAAARGLVVGSIAAFAAALVAAAIPFTRRSITRLAAVANAAPWVAVAPCLLIILGRDRGPVAVAAIAVFFLVFVSTTVGLSAAPAAAHDLATTLGASRRLRVWALQLPPCWPAVIDGLKLAAPAALAGAVFGEWYGAERGLGVLLITAMQGGRPERLWAASLLCAACGLAAYAVLGAARSVLARRYGRVIGQARAQPPGHRRGAAVRLALEALAIAALVALLVTIWWAAIEAFDVSPLVVPRPATVWDDMAAAPGEYADALWATIATAAVALVLGTLTGFLAAVAASRARILAGATVPVIVVLAATPLIALFPLFARVLGYDPSTVRVLAALMVFFPVFVYTRSGLSAAGSASIDLVEALGAPSGRRFRLVTLPAAVPHVVSGVRIAAGTAVIAAVVGETLIGRTGLGVEFTYAYSLLDLPRAFGAAVVIVVVSVAVFTGAGRVERAVHARWT